MRQPTPILMVSFLTLSTLAVAPNVQADALRRDTVLEYVRANADTIRQRILAEPELRQELGVTAVDGRDAQLAMDMAFQEHYLRDGITAGTGDVDGLVMEGSQVVVPLCTAKACLLASFDEDADSGELGLVAYGSSLRAERISESFSRLKALHPDYKGEAKIIDYPAGYMSFLMIDGVAEDGSPTKVFLHATAAQAERFRDADQKLKQSVSMEDMGGLVANVDRQAREKAVQLGLARPSTTNATASQSLMAQNSAVRQTVAAEPNGNPRAEKEFASKLAVSPDQSATFLDGPMAIMRFCLLGAVVIFLVSLVALRRTFENR